MGVLITRGCLAIWQCEMHPDKAAGPTPGMQLTPRRLLRLVLGLTASAIQRRCIHHWRWVIEAYILKALAPVSTNGWRTAQRHTRAGAGSGAPAGSGCGTGAYTRCHVEHTWHDGSIVRRQNENHIKSDGNLPGPKLEEEIQAAYGITPKNALPLMQCSQSRFHLPKWPFLVDPGCIFDINTCVGAWRAASTRCNGDVTFTRPRGGGILGRWINPVGKQACLGRTSPFWLILAGTYFC